LDADARAFRHDIAWMVKEPSAYFFEHFRIGTAPAMFPGEAARALAYLEVEPNLGDAICYASGLPGAEGKDPEGTAALFPAAWRDRLLRENARSVLRRPAAITKT
jgi:hypothetical protein